MAAHLAGRGRSLGRGSASACCCGNRARQRGPIPPLRPLGRGGAGLRGGPGASPQRPVTWVLSSGEAAACPPPPALRLGKGPFGDARARGGGRAPPRGLTKDAGVRLQVLPAPESTRGLGNRRCLGPNLPPGLCHRGCLQRLQRHRWRENPVAGTGVGLVQDLGHISRCFCEKSPRGCEPRLHRSRRDTVRFLASETACLGFFCLFLKNASRRLTTELLCL